MEQQPEESSFSHIWAHIQEHQCAMMTAFRGSNTRDINTKNNHTLLSTLKYLGYRVTKVIGTYPERVEDESGSVNDKTIKEELFFIVNRGDDPDFEKYIIKMSQSAKKNSVLIIPKGGKDAYVFDINDADWPGKGEKVIVHHKVQTTGFEPVSFSSNVWAWNTDTVATRYIRLSTTLCG